MRHLKKLVAVPLISAAVLVAASALAPAPSVGRSGRLSAEPEAPATISRLTFHDAMRKLWEDHITWTRMFIVSFAADLPDQDVTAARLLRNQADIGDAVKPFYGKKAGDQLTALLRQHILGAVDLLTAAKAGDAEAFDAAKKAWYSNAGEIAGFLHDANPDNWGLADLRAMMSEHLDLTLAEAADRLDGNFAADIADYDAVHREILKMADTLSRGIIRQFPARFS